VFLIIRWITENEGKFLIEGWLYPRKSPPTFHGCTMNLSALMKSGIEDELYSPYFLTHNITRNFINSFPDVFPFPEKILTYKQIL
jgi:hypothetical protein